ncbi:MAG TPA: SUMF1/EgtB/PvdO family nonheme iron enzyme [Verrucomicrobiae bacterium]|nr:SUMF1/EgtB/PvdO family nonheme iron enzyme [Verrucomicrobiae bacterium]
MACLATAASNGVEAGESLPAFPEAEGSGAFTPGGRGGQVLFVTTLADYDPRTEPPIAGSLRAALSTAGPRFVLFRVSGTIVLKSTLAVTNPYVTIAGQTAPGDGICIARSLFQINTHDVIVRHLRFRLGDQAEQESGTFQIGRGSQNVIADHCSMSWSTDENCTINGTDVRNITIQWCVIAESLNRSFHPKGEHGHGSLLRSDGGGFTIHHSIYAHNNSRNPRPGGYDDSPGLVLDFRNNVVYNWGANSGYSGLERTRINYVGNYFKPGPSTSDGVRGYAFSARTPRTKLYLADNFFYDAPRKTAENWRMIRKWGEWDGELKDTNLVPEPFPVPPVTTDAPEAAFEKVLLQAGALLPKRDSVDSRIVQSIRSGTGRIIDSQKEVGGWPELKSTAAPKDSDNDGMPDEWESHFGFNPKDATDGAKDFDDDGYSNLEEFLNASNPKSSDRKVLGFTLADINSRIEVLNAKARAEIAEEQRQRPAQAGTDGSAPPPVRKMEIRSVSGTNQAVAVVLNTKSELQLNWIPAGKFIMGSPPDEPERSPEEKQHAVTISKPFYMGATLVTADEYQIVTGAKSREDNADKPAIVTWPDAVRFCDALSKNTGRKFRLPTEAEWEYACRAGTTTPFNTGPQITTDQANFDGKFVYPGGAPGIYRRGSTPVRTFKPNAWGLFDMHGNAYQWCSDWYGPYPKGAVTDPQGSDHGVTRVIRGGKYGSGPRYIRSAARYHYNPNNSSVVFGFRVVMEARSDESK